MYYSTEYDSPVGRLTLASDGSAICGLWMQGQRYFGDTVPAPLVPNDSAPAFQEFRTWLDAYFAGKRPPITDVPLAPIGTEFRQLVWRILTQIPYGEVTTYGEIAQQVARERGGRATASRAVGGAVGRNPVSIIIPCHRVVGAGGSLTGYSGGIAKKIWLLEHEGANTSAFFVPKTGTAL